MERTRILDELADAYHRAQGCPQPRRITLATTLVGCFPTAKRLPTEWVDLWEIADDLARRYPDWEPLHERTATAWREAQIFVGVRQVLVEALNVEPNQVVRSARLVADLGAE
jgi:hypothetical protein